MELIPKRIGDRATMGRWAHLDGVPMHGDEHPVNILTTWSPEPEPELIRTSGLHETHEIYFHISIRTSVNDINL